VSVDGTQSTLDSIDPGQQVTLAAPSGSLSATVASSVNAYGSLLGVGTADAALVSTGNGSLSQVIANVNAAGLGATASSVTLPSGGLLLQVGAGRTGLAGSVSVDPAAFAGSGLGSLQSVTAAQDASVSVGGASGYTLTSATNVFSNLLPGTAVTVGAVGQATVSVQPDASGEATKVASLVSAANQALSDIASLGGYDATTKTAGPLMGSAVLSGLQQAILSVFGSARGTSSLANAAGAGITLGSDGTLSFDQAAFESAYAANPSTVQALFTQGVSFAPAQPAYAGEVSLLYAGDQTPAGSYDVAVTQSATQATDLGTALAGSVSVAEALTFTQGGSSATYQTAAGEGTAAIASGLNRAFAQQGLSLEASVDSSGALEVASSGYGSIQSFEVTSSASGPGASGLGGDPGAPVTFAGTDVEGTINGEAATGAGQVLAASATGDLAGLSVLVQAEGISGATDLGSVTYSPGVAQQLATLADGATNSVSGSLTVTMKGLADEAAGYDSGIAQYQQLEASQQTVLENEFATMEATLGTLKNESSLLSSQINQLPGF
jgi:flagellar hook-associated protein 2